MTNIWCREISLTLLNERGSNTMVTHLNIEFIDIGENFLIAKMPVDERTRQPIGIMHGGASCVLAETAGSTAANYCIDFNKFYAVGLDINTNHIRSIKEGFVYAKAQPFHLGRSTHVWGINIQNEKGNLISVNRLTMSILAR